MCKRDKSPFESLRVLFNPRNQFFLIQSCLCCREATHISTYQSHSLLVLINLRLLSILPLDYQPFYEGLLLFKIFKIIFNFMFLFQGLTLWLRLADTSVIIQIFLKWVRGVGLLRCRPWMLIGTFLGIHIFAFILSSKKWTHMHCKSIFTIGKNLTPYHLYIPTKSWLTASTWPEVEQMLLKALLL